MKNILYLIGILVITISCQEEFDPGATEPEAYAGDWYYQLQGEDGTVYYDFNYENPVLLTYNTAGNTSDEIWIEDPGYLFMKCKYTIEGTPEEFASTDPALNEYEIGPPDPTSYEMPEMNGQEYRDTIPYGEVTLLEGKILEGAATVAADQQNAPADSIYLKVQFNSIVYAYLIDMEVSNGDTTYTPLQQGDHESLEDFEVYVASGHRQTGWEVDF